MTPPDSVFTISPSAPGGDAPTPAAPTPPARHIPWLDFARGLRRELQSAGKAGVDALDHALAWASGARPIPARISLHCSRNPQRESNAEADALTRDRDTVFKVALLQALTAELAAELAAAGQPLAQGIAALRQRLASCTQPVPAGMSLDSPDALADAAVAADRWLQPWPQPGLAAVGHGPLPRWNNALALCALDHLAARAHTLNDLRLDLLNRQPLAAKFSPGPAGKLMDSNGTLAVSLHCQPWLAQLLKFGAAQGLPTPPHPWWTLRFSGLKHLGGSVAGTARTGDLKMVHMTGLKTANLHYAALLERLRALGQGASITPSAVPASAAGAAMPNPTTAMPSSQNLPAGLPAELQAQLPTGLHPVAACSVFALGQGLGSGPQPATAPGVPELIQRWSGPRQVAKSGILKTRRASPAQVAGLPARLTPDPGFDSQALGAMQLPTAMLQIGEDPTDGQQVSICLDPQQLNPGQGLAWLDVTVLVRQAGHWWVLPVALDDDPADATRLCLRPLAPWPPGPQQGQAPSLAGALRQAAWAIELVGSGALVCAALALN